jgi:deoxyribodipyrimidine photo-lyase
MASKIIENSRVKPLNDRRVRNGDYVLYWMQQSQRAEHNPALEYAIQQANDLGQRLVVGFGLMDDYPDANLRHYRFMLEGLAETRRTLERRGIRLALQRGHPADVALKLGETASLIVCDRGYLNHQKSWRKWVAADANCSVMQVEADVVVPVEVASNKAEYAARTLRPKINAHREHYLAELATTPLKRDSLNLRGDGLNLDDLDTLLSSMELDQSVKPSRLFRGGTIEAHCRLDRFIHRRLSHYEKHSNQPQTDDISTMSPYLHFGQVSPVYIALRVREAANVPSYDRERYLEQLIVRRELAQNFCEYTPDYAKYSVLPEWAKRTLAEHRHDQREHVYTKRQLENGKTHDVYWNAAMREMRETGYMHNYMRLYWGKKIIEWTRTPEYAWRVMAALNNKYFLDGRDPNSYANIGWIFGLHDHGWPERPIFGKVRYMSAGGLKRKTDPEAYVRKVARLTADDSENQ